MKIDYGNQPYATSGGQRMIQSTLLSLLALAGTSIAGPTTSGGGKTVVCRDTAGEISSIELLDLYEGRLAFQDEHPTSTTETEETLLENAVARLEGTGYSLVNLHWDYQKVRDAVSSVKSALHVLPIGTVIPATNDSFEVVAPNNCKIEQIAKYLDSTNIIVNGEMYAKLSPLQRAALTLHEALYAVDRQLTNIQDSRHARRAVSQALGIKSNFADIIHDLPGTGISV